jgi:hypothetical protein
MALLRVKRHMVAISVDQELRVSPSCTSCGRRAGATGRQPEGTGGQLPALFASAVLFQQQVAKALLEPIDDIEGRMSGQISR